MSGISFLTSLIKRINSGNAGTISVISANEFPSASSIVCVASVNTSCSFSMKSSTEGNSSDTSSVKKSSIDGSLLESSVKSSIEGNSSCDMV